ncbi:type II secretion system protein [Fervidobacterium sp.]
MRKGFTLVELLIVMSIIAALMAVATPVGVNALSQAKATNVAGNFRALSQAVIQMITIEQNPPTSGDILGYLYTNKYISSIPQGFQITYDSANKTYVIKYTNDDIDPTKVKNTYNAIMLDTDGKLMITVQKP